MEKQLIPDYIFEVSWEVCNKVGGIYTVLSTKARTLQKLYKDRIIFIGLINKAKYMNVFLILIIIGVLI